MSKSISSFSITDRRGGLFKWFCFNSCVTILGRFIKLRNSFLRGKMTILSWLGRSGERALGWLAPVLQRGFNATAPYILANLGALTVLDGGAHGYWDRFSSLPEEMRTANVYAALLFLNAGVLAPIQYIGFANYGRFLLGRRISHRRGYKIPSHAKTALLAGVTALGLGYTPLRAASLEALGHVRDDLGALLERHPDSSEDVSSGDPVLEQRLQGYIDGLRSKGRVHPRGDEDYALYVKDLHDGEVLVDMNSARQQLGASTDKVFVLGAAFSALEQGQLHSSPQFQEDLVAMIRDSSNASTNRVIDSVGLETIQRYVSGMGFSETSVDYIPVSGRTLTNKSSARDLAGFFELLSGDQLPGSEDMKKILSLKGIGHLDRLVDRTCIPVQSNDLERTGGYVSRVMDKTGFILGANGDAGLLEAEFYRTDGTKISVPYVVAILIEDRDAKKEGFRSNIWGHKKSEIIRSLSEACYWNLQKKYSDVPATCGTHQGVHPQ